MSHAAMPAVQTPSSRPDTAAAETKPDGDDRRGLKWWSAFFAILAVVGTGALTGGRFLMDWADRSQRTALGRMDATTEGNLVAKLTPKVVNAAELRGQWYSKKAGAGLEVKVDELQSSMARLESSQGSLRLSVQQEVGMLRQQQQETSVTLRRVDDRVDSAMKELGSMSGKLDVLIRMQTRQRSQ